MAGTRGDDVHTRDESQGESRDYARWPGSTVGLMIDRLLSLSAARWVAAAAATAAPAVAAARYLAARDAPLFCLACVLSASYTPTTLPFCCSGKRLNATRLSLAREKSICVSKIRFYNAMDCELVPCLSSPGFSFTRILWPKCQARSAPLDRQRKNELPRERRRRGGRDVTGESRHPGISILCMVAALSTPALTWSEKRAGYKRSSKGGALYYEGLLT